MAIIKIRNPAIDLDAAEIPNLDASKITTGSFDASRIGSGTFADARIAASNVSQHATSFDDNKIVNDISTLALRQASDGNRSAYNTNSQFVDVFQDGTGIASNTNAPRNTNEYVSTVSQTTTLFVPQIQRISTYSGGVATPSWGEQATSSNISNHRNQGNTGVYGGCAINELWDLAEDWTCKLFVTSSNDNGVLDGSNYMACGLLISDDTSISAGSDPDIFTWSNSQNTQFYGTGYNQWGDFLNSTAETAFGVSSLSSNFFRNEGNSNYSYNFSGKSDAHVSHYYNDGGADEAGFVVEHVASTDTITIKPINSSNSVLSTGNVTVTNVPSSGRVLIGFGSASTTNSRYWSTSFASGVTNNGDHSTKKSTTASASGNFESNTITAPSSVSSMGAIITYQDNAGTNALNTDIVLKLSADNGSNYSTATLTAMPDFSSGIKMAKVNDLSVTAGTQLKYKIEFANQALNSKEARIRGVSLQY